MFCSTIIPTVGRPTLSRSVYSVLNQEFTADDFEVIVVNDSGKPLAEADWHHSERVQIINTQARERSVARNTGAAIAKGEYLHFLDDDDWLLPGALANFWELANSSQAKWLYGGYNFVDATGQIVEEWHPDETGNCLIRLIAGEWIPIQASIIESKIFFAVGGFEPSLTLFEDSNLAQRIALQADMAGTFTLVTNIIRNEGTSTTDYSQLQNKSRWSRDKILNVANAFTRIRQSARSRPVNPAYWHGRITWAYLSAMLWNLQRNRILIGLNQGTYGLLNVLLSGRWLILPSFWRGCTQPHMTKGFLCRDGI